MKNFLKNRFVRLGIPFVIAIIFVNPVISYIKQLTTDRSLPGYFQYWFNIYYSKKFDIEHLWFLVCLIIFSIILSLIILIKKDIFENNSSSKSLICHKKILVIFVFLGGLLFFVVNLFVSDSRWVFFGSIQPTRFVLYAAYFLLGIYIFKQKIFFDEVKKGITISWFLSAIVLSILLVGFYSFYSDQIERSMVLMLLRAMMWSFLGLSYFVLLVRIFSTKFNAPSKVGKKLSDNAYAIYIFHLPFVLALQYLMIGMFFSPFIKFIIVSLVSFCISYLLSEYILHRIPIMKNIF